MINSQQQALSSLFPFSSQQQHRPHTPTHIISLNPSSCWDPSQNPNPSHNNNNNNQIIHHHIIKPESIHIPISSSSSSSFYQEPPIITHKKLVVSRDDTLPTSSLQHPLSATAILQKASSTPGHVTSIMTHAHQQLLDNSRHVMSMSTGIPPPPPPEFPNFATEIGNTNNNNISTWQKCNSSSNTTDRLTRDFLGLTGHQCSSNSNGNGNIDVNLHVNMRGMMSSFVGNVDFPAYDRDLSLLKHHSSFVGGFAEPPPTASETWGNCWIYGSTWGAVQEQH